LGKWPRNFQGHVPYVHTQRGRETEEGEGVGGETKTDHSGVLYGMGGEHCTMADRQLRDEAADT